MRRSSTAWTRAVSGLLVLCVGLAFAAPPATASDVKAAPTRPLAAATAAKLARLAPPARAFTQE